MSSGIGAQDDIKTLPSPGTSSSKGNRVRCFDEWTNLESSLVQGHPLRAIISYIIHEALNQFEKWKEARTCLQESTGQNESQGEDRNSEITASDRNREAFEFACPYYKKDPSKYSDCLKRSCLRTIGDVRDHVWQHHRIPFYCPICKRDFSTASGRDQHIVKRVCVIEDFFPFEGVSDDQRRRLFKRRRGVGARQQWYHIWKILLPKVQPPKSSMLRSDKGQDIAAFREFWSFHGEALVAKSVQTANLEAWDRRSEERDLASLFCEVMNSAIDQIFERLKLG
ncbi:hypothetical protein CCHR01_04755 [Colletotrichum chrysophilum]|uniref:C2H2-type domain-containing protein n=1 Tax=Colletotrichum chrysophilum TaxID=1836956 RepID=A0AAD9EQ71_9PEZI|nr:hypothetical protein CCHR01_04755 [Colletotrichum chrysophilum]